MSTKGSGRFQAYSCKKCTNSDNLEMVACDDCQAWYHFNCVNVDAEIEYHPWCCEQCLTKKSVDTNDKEPTASSSKQNQETNPTGTQTVTVINAQTALTNGQKANSKGSVKSISSRTSVASSVARLKALRLQRLEEERTLQIQYLNQKYAIEEEFAMAKIEEYDGSDELEKEDRIKEWIAQSDQVKNDNQIVSNNPVEQINQRRAREPQMEINSRVNFNKPTVTNDICQNSTNMERSVTYNQNQLAARQIISKDLVYFTGKPEEWPLFYSWFSNTTNTCGFTQAENLSRLQRCLKGKALEMVRYLLLHPSNVPKVISTLQLFFGKPELIVNSLIDKIKNEPTVKADKFESLVNFSLQVQNLCSTIEASKLEFHLKNPCLLQELVNKLPYNLKLDWGKYKILCGSSDLHCFSSWLMTLATAAVDVSPDVIIKATDNKFEVKKKAFVSVHQNEFQASSKGERCVICKENCKTIQDCKKFINMSINDRWDEIKSKFICRICLRRHGSRRCLSSNICNVNGCSFRHHRLLHRNNANTKVSNNSDRTNDINAVTPSQSGGHAVENCNLHEGQNSSVIYKILPVRLHHGDKEIEVFAFLDGGSAVTLIDDEIANALQLTGETEPLCLKWTDDKHQYIADSRKVSMKISSIHTGTTRKHKFSNVHTVSTIKLPEQSLNVEMIVQNYPYLQNTPVKSFVNAKPKLLIGLRHNHLICGLKSISCGEDKPVATKTLLGWTISGKNGINEVVNQDYLNYHICECQHNVDKEMHEMMKQYFAIDAVGSKVAPKLYSADEQRAIDLLEEKTTYDGQKYSVPLLWKYENLSLPDSLPMAMKRLKCLENRMKKDPVLAENLEKQIKDYEVKGYIRKLNNNELTDNYKRIWYLPTFPVFNKNKPGKIRIVWDAAARVESISLNSMLLSGPDNLPSLLGILFQFREKKIAIGADIREMFHRVHILPEDHHAQRFLWKNKSTEKIDIYVMQVMTFGATCSPFCASFIKNRNAELYASTHPDATEAIIKNHYVDDLLKSVDNEEIAIKLANDVISINGKAGFEIHNFISNSQYVISTLNASTNGDESKLLGKNIAATDANKLLGMWWCAATDTFMFKFKFHNVPDNVLAGEAVPSKREVLRVLMSIFDPLGLISHFLVILKIILQNVWRSGVEWDEPILEAEFKEWKRWISLIPLMKNISIRRTYLKDLTFHMHEVELHVFVDASQYAYSAVAYFRISNGDRIECSLVSSKSKVAPVKMLSIPRMELQAAVLGARLAATIKTNHTILITRTKYWTDSSTVLNWITSDTRKFKQYVAFRIGEILETTDTRDWQYVPSKLNVADDATKPKDESTYKHNSRWYTAPQFLYLPEKEWPSISPPTVEEISSEVCCVQIETKEMIPLVNYSNFSSWYRLLRVFATVLQFIDKVRHKKVNFLYEYVKLAETYFYKLIQFESYEEELSSVKVDQPLPYDLKVKNTSSLFKLSPYLDEEKVLRIKGRIDAANSGIPKSVKRPIILSPNHYITKLIVASYHEQYHHLFNETVVNELRQIYYIPRLRTFLKKVKNNCQQCKNERAVPRPPIMGELPPARLKAFTRPFTYVGIDYFGPILVTVGRHREKRWGALFTCLTIRAIHIEIVYSLNTDKCILALKRFIARRGTPLEVFSDNATNFRGASEELKNAVKMLDVNAVATEFSSKMKWNFIPPASPHMGGAWERLIRSVKQTLAHIQTTNNPSDELLLSMMAEVENVINSRPLTYVPLDNDNDEALTPNHFLLGSSSGQKIHTEVPSVSTGVVLKRNWLTSEQYATMFWSRWIKEVLPDLTRRTKWYTHEKPVAVGDIAIIVDDKNPKNTWPKGKVIDVVHGKDGIIRSATVKVGNSIYVRPVSKLAILDVTRLETNGKQANTPCLPGGSVSKPSDGSHR